MKDLLSQAVDLKDRREPFALATVVRCQRPASARPGARALIYPDGRLEGWIGGSCAKPVVVREALRALALGAPRLIRLRGRGGPTNDDDENLVEYPMTCHSGGTLEIYVEPHLPPPRLVVVGDTPAARALVTLASFLGYEVTAVSSEGAREDFTGAQNVVRQFDEVISGLNDRSFLVVAGSSDQDEQVLEEAVGAEVAYLAVVASPRRGAVLRSYLLDRGLSEAAVARLKTPAGLNIGAVEPEEIALSIVAEMTQVRRQPVTSPAPAEPATAVDPICGMSVEIATARHVAEIDEQKIYFCCPSCKRRYLEDHPRPAAIDTAPRREEK
jgi:xanthine dehydrogenase accessory factor